MLKQQTRQQLAQLKLHGMSQAFEEQPTGVEDLSFEERFSLLVDREITYRKDKRLQRLLRTAKFRHPACVEDIDYQPSRGFKKAQILSLLSCDWIREKQNLILTGPTGVGKSWLSCALGHQACRQGFSVRYVRLPKLLEELRIAHADGSYFKLMNPLTKTQLLILDDWGLEALNTHQRHDLLEIVEDRHQVSSTLITSQLAVDQWHRFIGEATLADAILDRLVHNAYPIDLKGESMRKLKSTTRKNT